MRMIHIDEYNDRTMQLAKPVYDSKRRILLTEGRAIHPTYLSKIKNMKIQYLFIEDAESEGITLDEMVDMPTWMDTILFVQELFSEVKAKKSLSYMNVRKIFDVVSKLLNESQKRPILVLIPTSSLTEELRPFAHAVNVTLLSLKTGIKMNLNMIQLRDLAVGALLHDIGKTFGEKDHPVKGFELLRSVREISILSAHMAYQHHEALDGSGYPRGVKDQSFLDFGQICGITNYYERLVSNELVPPHEAMELVMTKTGNTYHHSIVQAFYSGIPSYPPGAKVVLNNGEEALVYKIERNLHRPTVRILSTMQEMDLTEHPTIIINGIKEGV